MYFKCLEMFGFKSFADKTRINFERGITAVIGPNGCGKSNIADSVKWVLGEQSAKSLRGSHMEDVIFNGSDTREPLGYAEVSLTLSNEANLLPIEYDEVTISRRLYRSGESEYLINKNIVRLKDVEELFMGSGIGTNAYSMIEQGKIDQILSANPEDRREIFEEASGITKYKAKKKEAVRKLEYTEQNLLRVNDIIKEVERQILSIERQARKARQHQELFTKLKALDTKLAAYRYSQLKEKKERFRDEEDAVRRDEEAILKVVSELGRETEELKEGFDNLSSRVSGYRSDMQNTDMSLERNQDRVNLDRERLQELSRFEADQKREIDSMNRRVADMAKAVNEIAYKLTRISDNCKAKEDSLKAKEDELIRLKEEVAANAGSIKENKLKAVDILSAQSRLRNNAAKVASDIQNVSARTRRLRTERESVSKESEALEKNLSEMRLAVNTTVAKVETLENERIVCQNDLKKERDALASLDKNIAEAKNNILSLCSKLNFLNELVKRHEGFTGGANALLNALSSGAAKIDGFCQPLAELLEPKRGYESAVEAALAGNLQTIVVDSRRTAFLALDYLKKNNSGKASFIIKDEIHADEPEPLVENKLILGRILDFTKFDPSLGPLLSRLLGGVFLVNEVEDSIEVIKPLPAHQMRAVRFVTKTGEAVSKDTITGGAAVEDITTSLIGRQMRIKDTAREIEEAEKNVLGMKQEFQAKREAVDALQTQMKKVEQAIHIEEIDLAQKRSTEANLEKTYNKIKEEMDLVGLEIEETAMRQSELAQDESRVKTALKEAEAEDARVQNLILESQKFIEEGAKRRETLLVAVTQIQTELASLKSQEDEIYKNARAEKGYYDEQAKILESKRASLEESCRRQNELADETTKIFADTDRLKERRAVIERELGLLEGERSQLKGLILEKEKSLNEKRENLNSIKDRSHSIEMEGAQASFQMEALRNKIGQLYKIDLEEMLAGMEVIANPDDVQKEVDGLTGAVERIGPVNLVAIDEHKELEERFNFLKHQQDDLVNAKEQLLTAIKKINQTTKELFMGTFTAIQTEFRNYFRFLFGGGKAEIVLLDESDVLESGIEIIVRPPGKKLQTISLLSGGERALTAISLLFAIFKVKPSPFCLLDEIDAPLDESNIGRFGKVLQEFAKKSQFIIITHNKKTINISDVMYGITMEQSGISKIISVKFKDAKEREEETVLA